MCKLRFGFAASLTGAVLAASPAAFACDFRIDAGTSSVWNFGSYNPFDTGNAFEERSLTVRNTSNQACDLSVSVSTAGIGRNVMRSTDSSDTLDFNLIERRTSASISANSSGRGNSLSSVPFTLGPNEARRLSFGLSIPAGQIVDAARYNQQLVIEISDRQSSRIESLNVAVEALVPPLASVSLAGRIGGARGSRSALIDFGELTTGKVINDSGVAIRTVGTSAYRLNVRSENDGYLVREGDSADWKIDYMLFLNDSPVFNSNGRGTLSFGGTPKRRMVSVSFRIGNAEDVRAGDYSDLITISIEPQT